MRVLHLIHGTGAGGVEAAAAELREHRGTGPLAGIDYRVAAFEAAPPGTAVLTADIVGDGMNSPGSVRLLLREIRSGDPDLVITSLWRGTALMALARLLGSPAAWAVWVHNTRFTGLHDRIVHRWALPRADLVLCDSAAARDELVAPLLAPGGRPRRGRRRLPSGRRRLLGGRRPVPPAVLVRPSAAPIPLDGADRPVPAADEPLHLLFWGRLAPQKRLDLAVDLLAAVQTRRPGGADLVLVGPDGGEASRLQERIARRGLADHATLLGPADREHLADLVGRAHAFVQLSAHEGFGMSAHEALAAGMVCVLAPVGDLARDTRDGLDALHHHDDLDETARRLCDLADDPAAWARLGERAAQVRTASMAEELAAACALVLPILRGGPTAAAETTGAVIR